MHQIKIVLNQIPQQLSSLSCGNKTLILDGNLQKTLIEETLIEELKFDEQNYISGKHEFNCTAGSKFDDQCLKDLANEMNFEAEDPQPFLGFTPQEKVEESVEDSFDNIFDKI